MNLMTNRIPVNIHKSVSIMTLILVFTVFFNGSATAQEQPDMPILPNGESVRMQIDAMMMKDTMMISNSYHKDIEIFNFPTKVLASGLSSAKKYWAALAESKEQVHYEFIDEREVGDNYIVSLKKIVHGQDQEKEITTEVVFIYQFEDKKFRRIYFILN